jgi:hypothetical protein
MSEFGVDQWVELFGEVGLDQARRRQWHQLFEQRYPETHQSFLAWLGLDDAKIKDVRGMS